MRYKISFKIFSVLVHCIFNIFFIEFALHVSVLDNLITLHLCVQNNQIYLYFKNHFASICFLTENGPGEIN